MEAIAGGGYALDVGWSARGVLIGARTLPWVAGGWAVLAFRCPAW